MSERIRLAVLTESVSHFEAPLFRLCAARDELEVKVFYLDPAPVTRFDSVYGVDISWGTNVLDGYPSEQCDDPRGLIPAATEWGADVTLVYGYTWRGAPGIILRNWWRGMPQIHRGTMSPLCDPRRPIRSRFLRPLSMQFLRFFDSHHFGGDYSRELLRRAGAKPESLFFVPYSVDSSYFVHQAGSDDCLRAAADIRAKYGWSESDRVLLFIAQHTWFKGPDIAMRVFDALAAKDPSLRFLVAGSGKESDTMKAYASEHIDPSRIAFVGFVPSADTVPCYLASDLVVCTSRYETWARMVNEAMLCRRPCLVSTRVAASGGLVEDGVTGHVIDSLEVDDFVDATLAHFALDSAARSAMADAARVRALEFSYEANMDNVVAAARYALKRVRPGAA